MSTEGGRVGVAAAAVRERCGIVPEVVLVTGTGLGAVADVVDRDVEIPYGDIPGLPPSQVPGHPGKLALGHLGTVPVAVLQGRCHLYEGWSAHDVVRPLRVAARLGAHTFVLTNCAGALDPDFACPGVMLIEDQLNLTGHDPCAGPVDEELGTRFVDMTGCFDPALMALARKHASVMDLPLEQGIYCGVPGPALETRAERRHLHALGGGAVGQSSVLEVIAARALGLRVLGLSALANAATGGPEQEPDTLESILAGAAAVAREMAKLVRAVVPELRIPA